MADDVIKKVRLLEDTDNGGIYVYSNKVYPYDGIIESAYNTTDINKNTYDSRFMAPETTQLLSKPNQTANLFETYDASGNLNFYIDNNGDMFLNKLVWDDLTVTPSALDRPGVSDPDLVLKTIDGIGYYMYEFTVNDFGCFSTQLKHGYAAGEDIHLHTHWTPADRGVAESGSYVMFRVDYTICDINSAWTQSNTIMFSGVCTGTNFKHQLIGNTNPTGTTHSDLVSGSGINISAVIIGKISRVADGWKDNAGGRCPVLIDVDFHIPYNTLGSRKEYIK